MTLMKPWAGVAARLDEETTDGRTLAMPREGLELFHTLPLQLILVDTNGKAPYGPVGDVEAAWIDRDVKTLCVAGTVDLNAMGSAGEVLRSGGELHASIMVVPNRDGHPRKAEDWARKVDGWQLRSVAVHADQGSAWDPPVTIRLLRDGEMISWGRSSRI